MPIELAVTLLVTVGVVVGLGGWFVWLVVRASNRRGFNLVESVRDCGAVHRVKIRRRRDGRAYARVVSRKRP